MAVPKTTKTRCRDRAYKHYTNNIPTSFLHTQCRFPVISEQNQRKMSRTKKRCRDGVIVCLHALFLHLVSEVFGTAIPTSLCFIYFIRKWLLSVGKSLGLLRCARSRIEKVQTFW